MTQSKPFPVLSTERLRLDALTPEDRDGIYAIFSDPVVIQHYDVERFKEPAQASRLIEYFASRFDTGTGTRWAIRDKATGQFLGSCGFNTWNEYDYTAVIGYELDKHQWGKGYAQEAVTAILNYIFSESFDFYVNRIEALILPQNVPSAALATRLGFTREGTLRGKCYWNGDFHDMDMWSLLRSDWLK